MDQPQDHSEARALVARALVPYVDRPSSTDVARLVDDLITCGEGLRALVAAVPSGELSPRGTGALADWAYAIAAGPYGSNPNSTWNYARALARVVQGMAGALEQHRATSTL
ncbi:DUF6415 family natural product biosynthesis protein [Streptomyces sp. NPDC048550]|uniref:DUF6415 family natural product biosynthesis protein n=1 Tax=Streptomyces sp. NPDC048550 TaxID=3155739 RepID=UPI00342BED5D